MSVRGGRSWLLGVGAALAVLVGCSGGGGGAAGGSVPTFGAAVDDPRAGAAAVEEAVAVVVGRVHVSSEVERCIGLRLQEQPGLVAALVGEEGGGSGRAGLLAADCGRALELADGFVDGLVETGSTEGERACLRDVFVGLSAAERVGVTAAVTGTGGDEELDAAAELAAGVAACRGGER